MKMKPLVIGALALFGLASVCGQDYEREKRWADEIIPAIVVGDAVSIRAASGRDFLAIYTPGKAGKQAIVLVHSLGVHPDFGVVGILRASLADMGYTTLSIQLPVQGREATAADYYPKVFPDAADRMAKAATWLRERGHTDVVLLSHALGAWMANEYLDRAYASTPYTAWVVLGHTGGYSWGMRGYAMPILDVYGEQDYGPTLSSAARRRFALKQSNGSRQVMIAAADQNYTGRERELAAAIDAFLGARR